ncbi:MAG: tail fiber domain-containing protein [Candidatus Pacebacteria bacterium]|nr:tail fiber domain-containing protein [Candidatus Paceibacterota bacterium]
MIQKKVTQKSILVAALALMLGLYGAITVFAAPPNPGGYSPAQTRNPECMPGQSIANGDLFDCFVTAGGGSGWSLTGDAGTDGGVTNFIGTTDAVDFMIKVNGEQTAKFGQNGGVSVGTFHPIIPPFVPSEANGFNSFASGILGLAGGDWSAVFGDRNETQAQGAFIAGENNTTYLDAENSFAFGGGNNVYGATAGALGSGLYAESYAEITLGHFNTDYTPLDMGDVNTFDRVFTIGNGIDNVSRNNAVTLWKDGSFAYNDDNFQNDNPGTEQNMFYFNFGSHDGEGNVQAKKAIRLGSVDNDAWDISSGNVGNKSIAIGFNAFGPFGAPIASGDFSFASGINSVASGVASFSLGYFTTASGSQAISLGNESVASGDSSFAIGFSSQASGLKSIAIGPQDAVSSGNSSIAIGSEISALSGSETVMGVANTLYTPFDTSGINLNDRLFVIGNGVLGSTSDALTILKNGQTGIGIDNFEDILNHVTGGDGMLQVNGDIAAAGDVYATGIMLTSDRNLKSNIKNLSEGLSAVNELRPVSYTMNSNGTYQLGFIAQEVQGVLPELVNEGKSLSLNYIGIIPVLTNAIQELDFKFSTIQAASGIDVDSFFERIATLVKDTIADMTEIIVQLVKADRVETRELCVDGECFTGDDIRILRDIVNERSADSGDNLEQEIETVITDETVEESIPEETSAASEEEVTEEAPVVEESIVEEISEESLVIEEVPVAEESSEILE